MEHSISDIIKEKNIDILMQMVLSPNKDIAAGIEALVRGKSIDQQSIIPPYELITQARNQGVGHELEELMIEKSIETFVPIYKTHPDLLLFINISHDYLTRAVETEFIIKCAEKHGISPENIVFDLLPFNQELFEQAKTFTSLHRKKGFYICIDDIGVNYGNLDKILYINPDIIKVNRFKLQTLDNTHYRNNMHSFLKTITNQLGILVVEKGIESEEDFVSSLKSGAQFVQGFFVSKPEKIIDQNLNQIILDFRDKVSELFNEAEDTIEINRSVTARVINMLKEIMSSIEDIKEDQISDKMKMVFEAYPFIENTWLLDHNGYQIFDSFINHQDFNVKNSPIFHIYKNGSDFTSKELYRQLSDTILDVWVTKPYKSILTNNVCVGGSTYIESMNNDYIMCINVNYDRLIEHMKK